VTTLLKIGTLKPSKAPNLPLGPSEFDAGVHDQFTNVLRLYFAQIDNYTQSLSAGAGGASIKSPYGAFSSYTTQTATTNTATQLTFSQTDFSNSITLSGSNIAVTYPGIYNLQFSVQVSSLNTAPVDISIWLRQNGVDIVG